MYSSTQPNQALVQLVAEHISRDIQMDVETYVKTIAQAEKLVHQSKIATSLLATLTAYLVFTSAPLWASILSGFFTLSFGLGVLLFPKLKSKVEEIYGRSLLQAIYRHIQRAMNQVLSTTVEVEAV